MKALKFLLIMMTLGSGASLSQATEISTPAENALTQAYQQEILEIKKTEELERQAVRTRDDYEKRKFELEREVAAKQVQIEDQKMKQQQMQSQIQTTITELEQIEKDVKASELELSVFKQSADNEHVQSEETKQKLEASRKNLEDSQEKARATRDTLTRSVYNNNLEIQKMKAEVSVLEAKVESIDAQNANTLANEMKTRVELMALKTQIGDKLAEIQKQNSQLADSKKKFDDSQNSLRLAKNEHDKTEKLRADNERKTMAEVKKYNESTYVAQKTKSSLEADKIRLEAEIDRLRSYVSLVKKSNSESLDSLADSQANVMATRLALQTAKSELTQEMASMEKASSRKEKTDARLRKIASIAEASDIMDGAKSWIVTKSCKVHKIASIKSEVLPMNISVGQKLIAADHSADWIKVMNSSGAPAFINKDCGKFE